MKKLFKYSKFLHWMTFLCLCLPFFYTGCNKTVTSVPEPEQMEADTTSLSLEKIDTVGINSKVVNEPLKSIDSTDSKTEEKEEMLSETLSKQYAFLKPILVSKKGTFSGLAMIIDCGSNIIFFSIFIYFLFSILSLAIKYLDPNGIKSIVLLEVLSMLFLVISRPFSFFNDRLWGFWFVLILFLTVTIIDIYILIKYHQNKRKDFIRN